MDKISSDQKKSVGNGRRSDCVEAGLLHGEGEVDGTALEGEAEERVVVAVGHPLRNQVVEEVEARRPLQEVQNAVGDFVDSVGGVEGGVEGGSGYLVGEVNVEGDGESLLEGNGAATGREEVVLGWREEDVGTGSSGMCIRRLWLR